MQNMIWIYQIIILIKKLKCDLLFSTQKLKRIRLSYKNCFILLYNIIIGWTYLLWHVFIFILQYY